MFTQTRLLETWIQLMINNNQIVPAKTLRKVKHTVQFFITKSGKADLIYLLLKQLLLWKWLQFHKYLSDKITWPYMFGWIMWKMPATRFFIPFQGLCFISKLIACAIFCGVVNISQGVTGVSVINKKLVLIDCRVMCNDRSFSDGAVDMLEMAKKIKYQCQN